MAMKLDILTGLPHIDPAVKQMVLASPDFSVGDAVHGALVNKVGLSTPGRHSQAGLPSPRFVDIFFPGWRAGPYCGQVAPLTGLNDAWWSDFAVAVLCEAMDHLTKGVLTRQLRHTEIANAVADYNKTLNGQMAPVKVNGRLAPLYSAVFTANWADFSGPFQVTNRAAALAQYRQALKDGIAIHALWYAEGLWKNPDWELFHHYIKLMALGFSVAQVDDFIDELRAGGLPIPPDMEKGCWQSFTGYLVNKPVVDHNDIRAVASSGILDVGFGRRGIQRPEWNAIEFTAGSQPGGKYRG